MPRTARIAPNAHVYHILTRGNNRQHVFLAEKDYQTYLDLLLRYKGKFNFRLYHYVLMTNHVHLVLEIREKGGTLAEIMKGVNLSYARHFKREYGHIGHFWQDRYKSILISKDDYLLACASYVELNPVRAKMVGDPKEYKWSSYGVYAYGRECPLIDCNPIYKALSDEGNERRKKYREFVKGMLIEKDSMKGEMERLTIYGDKKFVEKMEGTYNISARTKVVGRPRKN